MLSPFIVTQLSDSSVERGMLNSFFSGIRQKTSPPLQNQTATSNAVERMVFFELFIVSVLFCQNGHGLSDDGKCSGELDYMERAAQVDECVAEFQEDAFNGTGALQIGCEELYNMSGCSTFMQPCYSTNEILNTLTNPLRYAIAKRTALMEAVRGCGEKLEMPGRNNSCTNQKLWEVFENVTSCQESLKTRYHKARNPYRGCQLVDYYAEQCLVNILSRYVLG